MKDNNGIVSNFFCELISFQSFTQKSRIYEMTLTSNLIFVST